MKLSWSAVPTGADSVIRVEDTRQDVDHVVIEVAGPKGSHIRLAGEDVRPVPREAVRLRQHAGHADDGDLERLSRRGPSAHRRQGERPHLRPRRLRRDAELARTRGQELRGRLPVLHFDWNVLHIDLMPSCTMRLPEIEAVAAQVHEAWVRAKRAQGVTSRKSETGEELMVDYQDLSESAKELDRESVRAVYAAIQALMENEDRHQ